MLSLYYNVRLANKAGHWPLGFHKKTTKTKFLSEDEGEYKTSLQKFQTPKI